MRSLRGSAIAAVLALGAICVAIPANAALLSDLVNYNHQNPPAQTPSIEQGDKIFDSFEVTVTGVPPYSADASNMKVEASQIGNDIQLTFSSDLAGAPIISADPQAYVDVLIGFDVRVKDPAAFQITAVKLSFDVNPGSADDGLAQISETVYYDPFNPAIPPTLLQVSTLGSSSTPDTPLPNPYTRIRVYKDITVIGGETADTAINSFTQLFIQTPEPAAISLLALGCLVVLRRRAVRHQAVWGIAIALAFGGLLIQPGTASAVPLKTLVDAYQNNPSDPAGELHYGDFKFDNFQFTIDDSNGSYIANPATIDVQGFTTPFGDEDGLRFVGTIAALSNMTPSSFVEVTLSYDVIVETGYGLADVTMSFNGAPTSTIDGGARVDKSVLNPAGGVIGTLSVWNQPGKPDDPKIKLQANVDLTGVPVGGYASVHVDDTIIVHGGVAGATTISYINQTFSIVPEPAALLMGLLGLLMLVRRRRAR